MTGFADREAVAESSAAGTSVSTAEAGTALDEGRDLGNTLRLVRMRADCDRDALRPR
jgi:phosphoribosyl-AMP cyclohydrolase